MLMTTGSAAGTGTDPASGPGADVPLQGGRSAVRVFPDMNKVMNSRRSNNPQVTRTSPTRP